MALFAHNLAAAFAMLLSTMVPAAARSAAPPAHPDAANPAADPMFAEPFIDKDEWRDAPVRHRYVHGGFKGTEMRFSFYLPPREKFDGRFFQYVTPVPDNENLAQTIVHGDDKIGFSIASGGYFVETNGGGSSQTAGPAFGADPKIGAFRANAAAARFSRKVAGEMYGGQRIFGYLFGGSGGGYRTLGSMEQTDGVWEGAVPFVLGSPMAAPNVFAVRMHAMRILKDKFPQIVDAMDAGGSGDPYAGLSEEEAAAFREVTRMGFPPTSWFDHRTMGVHAFTALYQGMVMADPSYFTDFWTKPGYLGFDPPDSLKRARLQFATRAKSLLSEDQAQVRGLDTRTPGTARGSAEFAWQRVVNDGRPRPVALELEGTVPDVGFLGGDLLILSGEAKGKRVALRTVAGATVTFGAVDPAVLAKLKPGDEVQVDNSNFLAAQTYHRHQTLDDRYRVWDQFRGPDGKAIYPQRKINLGPLFAMGAAGTVPSGKFNGKIIVVQSMLDREAFAWQADWYRQRFDENYGPEASGRYRVWYTENALHGYNEWVNAPTRVVSYLPMLQQALRDVSAWVERGVPPPATSDYKVIDGQVILPPGATARRGVQPVVTLTANGDRLARVRPGEPVRFAGTIAVPPGTGKVVGAEWDFDGSGTFAVAAKAARRVNAVVSATHSFDQPGTYFVTLRGASQRSGDAKTPYARLVNLARVRVVVE
jgi:hypothetical protein